MAFLSAAPCESAAVVQARDADPVVLQYRFFKERD
jgi:hypothetical protein